MANLFVQNDMNLTLDGLRCDADQSVIHDAVLTVHFFDDTATGKITGATNTNGRYIAVIPYTNRSTGRGQLPVDHLLCQLQLSD